MHLHTTTSGLVALSVIIAACSEPEVGNRLSPAPAGVQQKEQDKTADRAVSGRKEDTDQSRLPATDPLATTAVVRQDGKGEARPAPRPRHGQLARKLAREQAAAAIVAEPALLFSQNRPAVSTQQLPGRPVPLNSLRMPSEEVDRERYARFDNNRVMRVFEDPVSTFSIDVDSGSYANVRRMLNNGRLPVRDAVRAEELVNYFSYDYPQTNDPERPFSLYHEIAATPWNAETLLLHIGIRGYEQPRQELPPANLVFLVDVSGSMKSANKLQLLKKSLQLLSSQLDGEDRVSLVVYAGASGVVLEPTPGDQHGRISSALEQLTAGGSTNGGAGIRLAYALAEQAFIANGINRVLLATDGDFNVGTVNTEQLKQLVEEKRKTGIALSTLGFGGGNYNDHLMEQLADIGNGNYSYIDTLNEARKVLVDEMGATMLTIASDVKIQIEFNPSLVSEYRLIGYENRLLDREDFDNDRVDAGEIGAGHTVTALYEIALAGSNGERLPALRYQAQEPLKTPASELAYLKLRYKKPGDDTSRLLHWPLLRKDITANPSATGNAFRFSAAVAAFAQKLRGGEELNGYDYRQITELAQSARGRDNFGYRGEFISLVNLAAALASSKGHVSRNISMQKRH